MVLFCLVILLSSLTPASTECGRDERVVLPLGLFASSDVLRTAEALPAAELALQQINEDSDILPGYCIQQKVFSSECTFNTAIRDTFTFFNLYDNNSTVQTADDSNITTFEGASVFMVGGGCPERTEAVSIVAPFLYSLQIDYSLPRPSQREGTFHIMPLLGYITLATINFLDVIGASPSHLTWFQEDEAEFSRYELPHQLKDVPHWINEQNIYLLCALDLCDETGAEQHLMNVSRTIFFLEAHTDIMWETACRAIRLGAVYPNKLWILYGMAGHAWWNLGPPASTRTDCNSGEIKQFLDKAVTIVPLFNGEIKGRMPNATDMKLADAYRNLQNTSRRHLSVHEPLIYDAVWLTAEALNMSLPVLSESNLTLNSSRRSPALISALNSALESNTYSGLTGSIRFNNTFRITEQFVVLQYQLSPSAELALVPIANITLDPVSPNADVVFLEGYNLLTTFPDGIPKPPATVIRVVPWIAFGFSTFFCICGVVFAAVCIVLMFLLWNRREMKLTSPRLNLVMAVGGIVWYTSAAVITIPTTDLAGATALCEIRRWGWNIGATLFFVPLLLKNWRVYYIFHNPTQRKIGLKDWTLLLAIVVFLVVDIVLLSIFTSIPATRLTAQLESLGPFVKQINCAADESYIGFGILIGYRIVLCIIGCVLALQNRKVKIPELRESRQVGLATYAFLFAIIIEVATIIAVQDTRVGAILLTLEVQAATTFLLLILFVPKFYRATKSGMSQESGNEITQSDLSGTTNSGLESVQKYTLAAMQNENKALKAALKKYQKSASSPAANNSSEVGATVTTPEC